MQFAKKKIAFQGVRAKKVLVYISKEALRPFLLSALNLYRLLNTLLISASSDVNLKVPAAILRQCAVISCSHCTHGKVMVSCFLLAS